jgi:hypothetical protein
LIPITFALIVSIAFGHVSCPSAVHTSSVQIPSESGNVESTATIHQSKIINRPKSTETDPYLKFAHVFLLVDGSLPNDSENTMLLADITIPPLVEDRPEIRRIPHQSPQNISPDIGKTDKLHSKIRIFPTSFVPRRRHYQSKT